MNIQYKYALYDYIDDILYIISRSRSYNSTRRSIIIIIFLLIGGMLVTHKFVYIITLTTNLSARRIQ